MQILIFFRPAEFMNCFKNAMPFLIQAANLFPPSGNFACTQYEMKNDSIKRGLLNADAGLLSDEIKEGLFTNSFIFRPAEKRIYMLCISINTSL